MELKPTRTSLLVIGLLLLTKLVSVASAGTQAVIWRNPWNTNNYLQWENHSPENVLKTFIDGKTKPVSNIDSVSSADYLGILQFPGRFYRWHNKDILVTKQDDLGIGICDFRNGRLLIDNFYISFLEIPKTDDFVVLSPRPVPKRGGWSSQDYLGYKDHLYLIDCDNLHIDSSSLDPRTHYAVDRKLPGVITSPLLLVTDNKNECGVAFTVAIKGKTHLLVLDPKNLKTIIARPLSVIPLPDEIIQSYGGLDESLIPGIKDRLPSIGYSTASKEGISPSPQPAWQTPP